MAKTVAPSELYITRAGVELQVAVIPTVLNTVGNDLSTAVTGSTVLTAAVALASDLDATNTLVNQIKAALVLLGIASN